MFFVMTLTCSKHMYVELVTIQRVGNLGLAVIAGPSSTSVARLSK